MTARIYGLIDPDTMELRYVGQTQMPWPKRLACHIRAAKKGQTYVHNWINSCVTAPLLITLERDPMDLDEAERRWIKEMLAQGARLINISSGGAGITAAVRISQRIAHLGKTVSCPPPSWLGRHHTLESCMAISKARMGMRFSVEHRAAISAAQIGVPLSDAKLAQLSKLSAGNIGKKFPGRGTGRSPTAETREKISASQMGKIISDETRAYQSAAHLGKPWSDIRRAAYMRKYGLAFQE
jgi:hypothetical protein